MLHVHSCTDYGTLASATVPSVKLTIFHVLKYSTHSLHTSVLLPYLPLQTATVATTLMFSKLRPPLPPAPPPRLGQARPRSASAQLEAGGCGARARGWNLAIGNAERLVGLPTQLASVRDLAASDTGDPSCSRRGVLDHDSCVQTGRVSAATSASWRPPRTPCWPRPSGWWRTRARRGCSCAASSCCCWPGPRGAR